MRYGRWLVIGMFLLGALAIGGDGPKEKEAAASSDQTVPRARTVEEQLSTSTEGLREVPSPVPNGGTMVDLRGRFKNTMVLVSAPQEPLDARCVSTPDLLHELSAKRKAASSETD